MNIAAVLARHERVAFQFSGGRDSLAVLHLLRPWWDAILVVWMNPGAPLPEVVEQMARIRALVPNFMEIRGQQPESIAANGYPLDVVPVLSTGFAQSFVQGAHGARTRFQPFTACCNDNLWMPMHRAMGELGVTLVIRGQKDSDALRGQTRSGEVHEGIELFYPVEGWTDADVAAYLAERGVEPPAYYRDGLTSSPDCWNCTAYGAHGPERMRYLAQHHPEKWIQIRPVIAAARAAIRADAAWMDAALTEDA